MLMYSHRIRQDRAFAPPSLSTGQVASPSSGPPRWSLAIFLFMVFATTLAWAQPGGMHGSSYDRRQHLPGIRDLHVRPNPAQRKALAQLRQNLDGSLTRTFDHTTGVTRTLSNPVGFLTESQAGDPVDIALEFVRSNLDLLGLQPKDVNEFEITDIVKSSASGTTHIYLRQKYQGLPVYNGQLQVHVNRDGRISSVTNAFMPYLGTSLKSTRAAISAADAVSSAARYMNIPYDRPPREMGAALGAQRKTQLVAEQISMKQIQAELMWLPMGRSVHLLWRFQVHTLDEQHVYDITVDAEESGLPAVDGERVYTMFDWVTQDSYKVYPIPAESPNHQSPLPPSDGRTLVTDPADGTASSLGWHDTGGSSFTIMRGNNVHAYHDQDANNSPPVTQPSCGANLNCNFPVDLSQDPADNTEAAVTNLFYWNNIVHDIQYQYGFDEQAGNFQVNNFGKGGAGGDDVRAEAQDGSGTNNANFLTPPDGQRPRMQMFLWNQTNPRRDGDLDNSIIVHEYGHGISTRQVGGPNNVGCLNNNQQPGEGWSDWFALVYTGKPGDQGSDPRGIGTYALGQSTTGPGIRTQRYSTNPAVNNHTYESINGMAIPHGVGEVWAQGLWEVYWALVDKYGFDPNLYNVAGGSGNHRALLYVNEGLKNTACNPTFTDARDGIIQAAIDNFGGEDVCLLWEAFADFGLGVDAVSGGANSTNPTNGFNVPASCVAPPPTPVCEAGNIDFTSFPTEAYSNQDGGGSVTVENSGDTLLLEGNRWRRSTQSFEVTADTVLEFQYQSSAQGEIHGIGFDEDQDLTNDLRIFQTWGTQNWTGAIQFTPRYSGSGDFESFSIPIGQSYTGTAMRLVFVNDKDTGTLSNTGRFACVRVHGGTPNLPAVMPFTATFDGGVEGFRYIDDAFRGSAQPAYANGRFLPGIGNPGGGLSVDLGGVDDADILNMSGGWQRTFRLTEPTELLVSFDHNLTQGSDYESDEFSQTMVSVNGVLFGQSQNDYVAQIVGNGNGGGPESTGWQSFQVNIGIVPAGDHQIIIGGFNNKKTFNDETTTILIDNVMVTAAAPPVLVTVPDLVGLSQADAEEAIVAAGVVVGEVTTQNNNTVPAGNVISQNPMGGTQVPPGSSVDLAISLGPFLIPVPNVVELAQAAAEAAITGAGLVVGSVTTAPSETVPAGDVISQNPPAGATVIPETMVDLVVSSGPAPADVIDWNTTATVAYSNQDGAGSIAVEDGGATLFLTGNRWRRTEDTFTITPFTVVEFEFQSGFQGEIHGIGFDEDDVLTNNLRIFRIYGTQNWTGDIDVTPAYTGSGAFEKFSIPVGQFYTGSGLRLVVVNDKDAGALDNTSRFRNVRIFEDLPQPGACTVETNFDDGGASSWTNSGASTCTTGSFVVGTPTQVINGGVTTQVAGDHTTGSGNAFFTAVNTNAGVNDVDNGNCITESATFAVAEASDLSIWYYHGQRDAGDDPSGDFFNLQISTDGGTTWSSLVALGDQTINAAWTQATATVPAGSNVKVRVQVSDGAGPGDLVEAGIDDFSICPTGSAQ